MKFSIKNLFRKCDQSRSFLWIWSHLLKKPLMENFIFSAVLTTNYRGITLKSTAAKICDCYYYFYSYTRNRFY